MDCAFEWDPAQNLNHMVSAFLRVTATHFPLILKELKRLSVLPKITHSENAQLLLSTAVDTRLISRNSALTELTFAGFVERFGGFLFIPEKYMVRPLTVGEIRCKEAGMVMVKCHWVTMMNSSMIKSSLLCFAYFFFFSCNVNESLRIRTGLLFSPVHLVMALLF